MLSSPSRALCSDLWLGDSLEMHYSLLLSVVGTSSKPSALDDSTVDLLPGIAFQSLLSLSSCLLPNLTLMLERREFY